MSEDNRYIDPDSTNLVIDTLHQAIDEDKLLQEVDQISQKISSLENSGVPLHHLKELNQYITVLEVQVNYLKDRTDKLITRSNN